LKKLIVTGDDFGMSMEVNDAIEEAHRQGILTTASLMIGAEAAVDAIDRARKLPSLRVGLHLVVVDGPLVLPAGANRDFSGTKGDTYPHLVRAGIRFFFLPKARRQLEAEIRAQFQAFKDTRLLLDHVNSHHHIHLHPTVLNMLLKVGKEYGLRAVRLPYEPPIPSWQASRKTLFRRLLVWFFLYPWITLFKRRLRSRNICSNDFVYGMNDSGHMTLDLFLRFLKYLPDGVTEIYFHPVISKINSNRKGGNSEKEFEALTSPHVRQTIFELGIQLVGFSDLG
jgi:hopanoid biosynthesis associated protein HpnK